MDAFHAGLSAVVLGLIWGVDRVVRTVLRSRIDRQLLTQIDRSNPTSQDWVALLPGLAEFRSSGKHADSLLPRRPAAPGTSAPATTEWVVDVDKMERTERPRPGRHHRR